jgi:ankyrin repeat protein
MQAWSEFAGSLDLQETKPHFSYLNSYLELKTFLLGSSVSECDVMLYERLKAVPGLPAMLGSRQRPSHLSRWWTHLASLYPDPEFEAKWKKPVIGDLRLLKAFRAKDFESVKRFMDIVDVHISFPNKRASRAIHYACKMQQPQLAKDLLDRGVDVNSRDGDGMTPLLFAVLKSNDELIEMLLERGADALARDGQERTLFYIAANAERLDLLKKFTDLGVDPNHTTLKGRTALAKAAWNGQVNVVSNLLSIPGVSVHIPDIYGRTALHAAVWGHSGGRDGKKYAKNFSDCPESVELLISHGADVEQLDLSGNSPLLTAAKTNGLASIKLLLKHKANLYHTNYKGRSALHMTMKFGFLECAEVLLDAGLDVNFSVVEASTPMMACILSNCVRSAAFMAPKPKSDLNEGARDIQPSQSQKQAKMGLLFNAKYLKACVKRGSHEILQILLDHFLISSVDQSLLNSALKRGQWKTAAILAKYCEVTKAHILHASQDLTLLDQLLDLYPYKIDPDTAGRLVDAGAYSEKLMGRTEVSIELIKAVVCKGLFALVEPMLKADVDWLSLRDAVDHTTPLHMLAAKGETLLAQHLLEACGHPQRLILMTDTNGLTAVDTARIHKHNSFADFLESFLIEGSEDCPGVFKSPFKVIKPVFEDLPGGFQPHPVAPPEQHSYPALQYTSSAISLPLKLVNTPEALCELRNEVFSSQLIGLDIECFSIDDSRRFIALLQMTVKGTDYIVDALINREQLGQVMREIMGAAHVVKVMHGCDTDMLLLQSDFQAFSLNVFDTARAYACLYGTKQLPSYLSLLKTSFDITIDKSYQISDWRIRPLPGPMLEYARTDSHYLPELYSQLKAAMTDEMLSNLQRQVNKLTHKVPSSRYQRIRLLEPSC